MKRYPFFHILSVFLALAIFLGSYSSAFAKAVKQEKKVQEPTIAEIAVTTPGFTTLVAALKAAGLVGVFSGKGQYTVFAPTDAAFAKLGLNAGNIDSLGKDALTDILLYHVARGDRGSKSVLDANRVKMLDGNFTKPSFQDGAPTINDSKIVLADIQARNGVIHVIDTVLLPPSK